jgi:hydrogenase/urease accessory protein HupE
MRLYLAILLSLGALPVASAQAHELRPAYLEIKETSPHVYAVLWKVPARDARRLALYVRMPEACTRGDEPAGTFSGGAYLERWRAVCEGGLANREITIIGLRESLTDVLARVEPVDGTTQTARLTSQSPILVVSAAPTLLEVAQTYFALGLEHILAGIDHLLFVLALMLLIRDPWMLVKTVTAFTVAHSITLAGAALGLLGLPQKPVEAVIAVSIAFVAREVISRKGDGERLSRTYPWVVAFAFGLLHGFGFAGALKEIGLPQTDAPLALLTFNLGVEAGQLLFVAGVISLYRLSRLAVDWPVESGRVATAYAIGIVATYWAVSRVADFWA